MVSAYIIKAHSKLISVHNIHIYIYLIKLIIKYRSKAGYSYGDPAEDCSGDPAEDDSRSQQEYRIGCSARDPDEAAAFRQPRQSLGRPGLTYTRS